MKGNLPFATTWMNLEDMKQSEKTRSRQRLCDPICTWSLKGSNSWKRGVGRWLPGAEEEERSDAGRGV